MASKKTYTVLYRRKRTGRTNYKKRIASLKSNKTRLVVRKTNKNIIAQLIDFDRKGDKVLLTISSSKLGDFGWALSKKNIPAAYLLGLLVAKTASLKEAVLDIGFHTPTKGGKVFATLKGAVDGGLKIAYSEENLPSEDRIGGKHISKYLEHLKSPKGSVFSKYVADKINDKIISEMFIKTKENILKGNKYAKEKTRS